MAVTATRGAVLAAIAANSTESCALAAAEFPTADVYADYRRLLERDDIDAVNVVVPSHLHHEIGVAVLNAGKHLLLEKPMALSMTECDDLISTAQRRGKLLAVGHEFRLSSLWGKVKELVDDGFVGEPQYGLIELARNPYRHGSEGWRYDINRVGNWILEEPIHFFDLARWYFSRLGDPQSVYATASSRQPGHPELQDNFSAILRFPRSAYFVVSQTLSAFEHHQTVKIAGDGGALWASWSGAMDRTLHPTFSLRAFDGEQVSEIAIETMAGEVYELAAQIAMFVQAICEGAPLSCTAEDGRWSVYLCQSAQQSVETGMPVSIGSAVTEAW